MAALKIEVPFPVFPDLDGTPLEDGYIYIGQPNLNPETSPVQVYWDSALTIPAAQPIRTIAGYPSRSGSPGKLYVDGVNFSITVRNKNNNIIWSELDGSGISPNASGINFIQAGTGAVTRTVQSRLREIVSVLDFGATGDGTTDDATAIAAAITYVSGLPNGGVVYFPKGVYRIATSLAMASNVSLLGDCSLASQILADDVDAVAMNFTQSFGNSTIEKLYLNGTNGTTRRGIVNETSLNDADELYGVTIRDVIIANFNIGIAGRHYRNLTLDNLWIQHVNQGVNLTGKNLLINMRALKLTYGSGNGTGTNTGITLNSFNFTAGTGIVPCEGVSINDSQCFGFNIGIDVIFCNKTTLNNPDIDASVTGIQFTTAQLGFSINDPIIIMKNSAAAQGIYGKALSTVIDTSVDIKNPTILGVSTTSCNGIQINASGMSNQNRVHIKGGNIDGMTSYDIIMYNPGRSSVKDVSCLSTGVTKSIKIGPVQAGIITATGNDCVDTIETEDADAIAGKLRVYNNIVNGTDATSADSIDWEEEGTWTPVDSSGDSLTFTNVTGSYVKHGSNVKAKCTFTYPSTASSTSCVIGGLPYTCKASNDGRQGFVSSSTIATVTNTMPNASTTTFNLRNSTSAVLTNANLSGGTYHVEIDYNIV